MIERSEFESKVTGKDIYKVISFTDRLSLRNQLRKCNGHIITKVDCNAVDMLTFLYERFRAHQQFNSLLHNHSCNI